MITILLYNFKFCDVKSLLLFNSPLLTRRASSFEDEGFESRPADQNVLSCTQVLLCVHTRDWKYAETDWAGLCSQVVSRGYARREGARGWGEQKAQPRAGISSLQGQHLAYTHTHGQTRKQIHKHTTGLFSFTRFISKSSFALYL